MLLHSRFVRGRKIIWILALLSFIHVGLANSDDDLTFDDEDLWESRTKREAKPRRLGHRRRSSDKNRLARRQAIVASGSGERDYIPPATSGPKFYRLSFIVNQPYQQEYGDTLSKEFTEFAQLLGDDVNDLYIPLPGRQVFTVLSASASEKSPDQIVVTGDIGTEDFYNDEAIKLILEGGLETGRLGGFGVLADGLKFEKLSAAGDTGNCPPDHIKCRTGAKQCIPEDLRCNGIPDCEGGEDEDVNFCASVPDSATASTTSEEVTQAPTTGSTATTTADYQTVHLNKTPPKSQNETSTADGTGDYDYGPESGERLDSREPAEPAEDDQIVQTIKSLIETTKDDSATASTTTEEVTQAPTTQITTTTTPVPSIEQVTVATEADTTKDDQIVQIKKIEITQIEDRKIETTTEDGTPYDYNDNCRECTGNDDEPSEKPAEPVELSTKTTLRPGIDNCRGDSKVPCRDGSLICSVQKCDGNIDCSDRDDEEDCDPTEITTESATTTHTTTTTSMISPSTTTITTTTTKPNPPCALDQWQCREYSCLPVSVRCDSKKDCDDGSDEENCPPPTTPPTDRECVTGEFKCGDGTCIQELKKCNMFNDCADGSDEIGCACNDEQFQCNDGTCIDSYRKCDDNDDCLSREDEENCRCLSTEFVCANGKCTPTSKMCDQIDDCGDGSDESIKACVGVPQVCQAGEFRCGNGTCIDIKKRCNHVVDCPKDDKDEQGCLCNRDEWQCDQGTCIDIRLKCDGKIDCPTDSSDETECSPAPPGCPSGKSQCSSGECFDSARLCDGNFDCPDESDEQGCPPKPCPAGRFQCLSGQCVDLTRRCDKTYDCTDGSDELGCIPPTAVPLPPCSSPDVLCGDGECVRGDLVCNGFFDCTDGKDETGCTCRSDEFTCGDGSCIDQRRVCDGSPDCIDRSDERNCPCRSDEFTCGDGSCINQRLVCDGNSDCIDRSDERNCPPVCSGGEFQCGDGTCINDLRKCDTNNDCTDGSDELGCACRAGQFTCGTGQCIDGNRECDKNVDCPDRSDEHNRCPGVVCQQNEFQCKNNLQCVPARSVCDDRADCNDQSDEVNCRGLDLNLKTYPNEQTIKQALIGREVVFQCRDEGPLRVPVRWVRGSGLPLPPGSRDISGRLEMPNIQLGSSGTYICEAIGYGASVSGSRVSVYLNVEASQEPTVRPPSACGLTEATCMNGQCIEKSFVCNGNNDCADASDEMRCPPRGIGCEPNEFQCSNKRCVLKTWRCDGDDDCGDNSDERYCDQGAPGSQCKYDEFQCSSGSQCIPKSFHCDMEIDCQDRSDEIGCAPPTIAIPPATMLMVQIDETFALNCTAVGQPVPEIVWRLNWGHVPPKCTMTSENGYGVLTCSNAVETDQGAYSCEAINAKGSTFAVPDCIVVVKPREGVCPPGTFNAAAASTADCLPCFAFGITTECSSTSLVITQLPQPSGQFQIIGVTQEPRGVVAVRAPLTQSYVRTSRSGQVQVSARDKIRQLGGSKDTLVFFNMPPSHRGNHLRSYGGHLKYNVDPKGQGRSIAGPDVVLVGNGYILMHFTKTLIQPNRPAEVTARFWPGEWYKRKSGRPGGDIPSEAEELATREEIMMALQNVEYLLIRASYVDSSSIDTTVNNIRMDTAAPSGGQDQAVYVEESRCPPGYLGLSCESCEPGYHRVASGPWLGRCVEDAPVKCFDGSYGDPGRGIPCQPCPCPRTTGIANEIRTCALDTDGQVTCNCPPGYDGRRCQNCAVGYTGDARSGDICRPIDCNTAGTASAPVNGQCPCKPNAEGSMCDQCRSGTFGLSAENPQGCSLCFCAGITSDCGSASNLHRSNVTLTVAGAQHGFTLSDSNRFAVISEGIQFDQTSNAVSYVFPGGRTQRLYWSLPPIFTGNKLNSYGSYLTVTQYFEERPGFPPLADGDFFLFGNGISIFWINPQPLRPSSASTISVPLRENGWLRMDGRTSSGSPASREDFLMVLANVEALLVRATFSLGTTRSRLSSVIVGSAVEFDNGEDTAREVEQCRCPVGYQGNSCESCSPGFYRDSSDRSLSRIGSCKKCRCSGNEESCSLDYNNQLVCICKPGFDGRECETEAVPTQRGQELAPGAPPRISIDIFDSQIQIAEVGNNVTFRCSAKSIDRPGARITLRWSKEGSRLPSARFRDNSQGQLLIYNVQPDDAGTYRCSASDGTTTSYEDAVLNIAPPTTTVSPLPRISVSISEPKIQIVQSGQTTRFLCSARSISSQGGRITLRWSKEEGSLPPRRAVDNFRGGLTISSVRPEDAGTYVCTATDGVETNYETSVLEVGGPEAKIPSVSIQPNFVDVTEGGQVEVRCLADGYPRPSITWTSRSGNLPRGATQDDGVLKIASVTRSEEGEYTCTARNPSGEASGRLQIYVRSSAPPTPSFSLKIEPQDSRVYRGDSIRLVCNADAGNFRESLIPTWTKSSGSISSRGVQSGGVLTFSSISQADSGIYICTVTTRGGSVQQAQARITVSAHRGPPTVRVEPEKQTISQKTSGELRCLATGDPAPSIRWSKVGEALSANIQINGPVLRISNAGIEDRGMYVCTAENAGGNSQAAALVEIDRREPPTIEMYPSNRQTITMGASAIFQCRITGGIPSPKITWSRQDGRPLANTIEEIQGGVIRFSRVTGVESGQYTCEAQNEVGVSSANAFLEIQKIPSVTITPSGSQRVTRGQRVRLECIAEGDPAPSVSWKRVRSGFLGDATIGAETSIAAIYDIASVTSSDEGAYSCVARNAAGVSEERLQLVVESAIGASSASLGAANVVEPIKDEVFTVPVGGNAEMSCVSYQLGGLQLEWIRDNGLPMPANHYVRGGTLYINNAQPEASGDYTCQGVTSSGTVEFAARARLTVIAPPTITIQPIRQVVRPGDLANVHCSATGETPITVAWSKVSGQLSSSVIVNAGHLQFRRIEVSDAGRYVCVAQNSVGIAQAIAEVVVNANPPVSSQSKTQTAESGSDVSLRCDVPSSYNHRTVWTRDRGPLPPTAISSGNILNITNVQVTDSGRYYCEVTTQGSQRSDFILLDVQKIKSLPMKISANLDSVELGNNLEIRCEVTGEPSALITWSRMGGPMPANIQPFGSVLRVYGVSAADGGVYRCSAVTSEGRQEEDYVLAIQANLGYADDAPPVETKSAPIGSTVVMDCRTNLQPPLNFSWSRQGGGLPRGANPKGATVTLPNVRAEDAGTYICTATSTQDSTSLEIPTILSVTGVVPYFLQAPLSYLALPTLPDAYLQFDIEISFKPEVADGLILYNAQHSNTTGDFIAFGLSLGYPEFRFDVGSGPAILRSDTPIEVGKWHTVRLSRNRKDGIMIVNGRQPVVGTAVGKFQGLDLLQPLYIGAVPDLRNSHKQAGFTRGFVGCISRLVLGSKSIELVQEAQMTKGVTSCETCAVNACLNKGVCQEAYAEQGYSCLCTPGFSGYHCEKIGETCYPGGCGTGRCVNDGASFECYCPLGKSGPRCEQDVTISELSFRGGAYTAYPTPKALRAFRTDIKFRTDDSQDSIILYCGQNEDGQGDFISIGVKDRHVEFRFDTGSGPAIIKSDRPIKAGEWNSVTAVRNLREGTLTVNDMSKVRGQSPGTMGGLNLKTNLYLGGWDRQKIKISPGAGVSQAFNGCISHLNISTIAIDLINNIVDSSNVEDCAAVDTACSRNPCQNGAECLETGPDLTDYVCQCLHGFEGPNCEKQADICSTQKPCQNDGTCQAIDKNDYRCRCPKGWGGITCVDEAKFGKEANFVGDSYVELDRLLLPHTAPLAKEVIAIEFSTLDEDGMLFWHGQKPEVDGKITDYISIAIVDGLVEFSYELGSGPAKIVAPIRVDDGKRHRVVATRTGSDGSLKVDSVLENGQSGGTLKMLNARGNIYIGGVPNIPLMTGAKHKIGLQGCIHKLSVQTDAPIDLYGQCLSSANVTPCSSSTVFNAIASIPKAQPTNKQPSTEGRGDISFTELDLSDEQNDQQVSKTNPVTKRKS